MDFHGLQLDLSGFDGSLIEVLEAAVDFRYEISRTVFPDFFQVPKPSSRVFSGQQASPMVWYIYIYRPGANMAMEIHGFLIEKMIYKWWMLMLYWSRKLVGGDWNHGILNDFPFTWEYHNHS